LDVKDITYVTDRSGSPALKQIRDHYNRIKTQMAARDGRMQDVLAVRQGRMRDVYPDLFPEGPFNKGIVANMVDVAARDLAETLSPLPAGLPILETTKQPSPVKL
jgi:hypothetical protein